MSFLHDLFGNPTRRSYENRIFTLSQDLNEDEIKIEKKKLKRLNGTNNYSIEVDKKIIEVSESKLSHLLNSNVFYKYFESPERNSEDALRNFYVIEEEFFLKS